MRPARPNPPRQPRGDLLCCRRRGDDAAQAATGRPSATPDWPAITPARLIGQHRVRPAPLLHARRKLRDLSLRVRPGVLRIRDQLVDRPALDLVRRDLAWAEELERRRDPRAGRRAGGDPPRLAGRSRRYPQPLHRSGDRRHSPPRKVTYFEPASPRCARGRGTGFTCWRPMFLLRPISHRLPEVTWCVRYWTPTGASCR